MPIMNVRGIESTTVGFRRALQALANRLQVNVNHLAAVIAFETAGTFAPDVTSGGGRYRGPEDDAKAVGLIQFTNVALRALRGRGHRITKAELAVMTAEAQLGWVERYFVMVGAVGKMNDVADCYMAVFAPAFIGAARDAVLYRAPTRHYEANRGLDRDGNGTITKHEAASGPEYLFQRATEAGYLEPVPVIGPPTMPAPAEDGAEVRNFCPGDDGAEVLPVMICSNRSLECRYDSEGACTEPQLACKFMTERPAEPEPSVERRLEELERRVGELER